MGTSSPAADPPHPIGLKYKTHITDFKLPRPLILTFPCRAAVLPVQVPVIHNEAMTFDVHYQVPKRSTIARRRP